MEHNWAALQALNFELFSNLLWIIHVHEILSHDADTMEDGNLICREPEL